MEKKEAIQLIDKTFNARFEIEQYTFFMRNLLNDYDEGKERDWAQGNYIYEAFREHINRFKRLGVYTDPEGNEVELLVIETKTTSKLERARTSLRNFVIKRLSDKNRDYALAAFYSKEDNGSDWRFSFIKIEHESYKDQKGKVKTKKDLTPAKRYSFLVGEHEQAHTAQKQLLPILQNTYSKPAVDDIEGGFSIEKVTDEFFEQYKDLYIKLSEHFEADKTVQKILKNTENDIARFTKKLLGQIVFLYFLQKKGWLGVPKNEAWGKGEKRFIQNLFTDAENKNKNFFNDYLKYLFYEALAKARSKSPDPAYYKRFDCKIPFLNGGLFEADYEWEVSQLIIPNELFRNEEKNKAGDKGTGVLDVFDRYNFTIKEDEPLEKEVAVDPEMLGKVFENMLEITERKSKGAFYTPREIVHYMCQESLIHYLNNSVNDAIDSYQAIDSDQLALIGGSTNKKGQAKIELELKGKILVPKEDIEIFIRKGFLATDNDQNIIEKGKETAAYKFQLPESIRLQADLLDEKLTTIKICDPAIGSGAFPVGLLHQLVTAQKVLLPYLSKKYLLKKLVEIDLDKADYEKDNEKYTYRVKRHAIQESIYGVDIDASAIDIARLRLWLSLIVDEDDFYSIEALPNLDYKITKGSSIYGLPTNSMKNLNVEIEIEKLKDVFFNETDEVNKKKQRKIINEKITELFDSAEQFTGIKTNFDFKLIFSEVWHSKGGFDIVIGNPPYGETIKENKEYFKTYYSCTEGKYEIYKYFIEKSLTLINEKGNLSFITPDTWTTLGYFKKLRHLILTNFHINLITETLYNVFKHAVVDTVIFSIQKSKSNSTILVTNNLEKQTNIFLQYDEKDFSIVLKPKDNLIAKIETDKQLLEANCEVWQGLIAYGKKNEPRRYTSETKDTPTHRKLLYGGDISKYNIKWSGEYLNYGDWLHRPRPAYIYDKEKILVQRIRNPKLKQRIVATIDKDKYINGTGSSNILLLNQTNLTLNEIWVIINSTIINYWFSYYFFDVNIKPEQIRKIPLPKSTTKELSILADYLFFIFKTGDKLLLNFFNTLADSIVFELYFGIEIKSGKKGILSLLGELKPINMDMTDENKLAIIQSAFNRLYDPNHPVRNNIETLDSIEEVRIIKEALK